MPKINDTYSENFYYIDVDTHAKFKKVLSEKDIEKYLTSRKALVIITYT